MQKQGKIFTRVKNSINWACGAFFFALCLTSGFSDGTGISVNAVGAVRVTIPSAGGFSLVAVNFVATLGSNLTLLDVFSTNQLTRHDNYDYADKVYLWNDAARSFDAYAQKASGLFYRSQEWEGGGSTNPVVPSGAAIWLQSSSNAATEKTVVIAGGVVTNAVVTRGLSPGYHCLGAPFSSELVLTNNAWLADGASGSDIKAKADQIMVWNGSDYDRYGLAADGRWYRLTSWVTAGGAPVERIFIPGSGGWYLSGATWIWTESKPYSWP